MLNYVLKKCERIEEYEIFMVSIQFLLLGKFDP